MDFASKYISLADYEGMTTSEKEKVNRVVLSDDAFAIGEMIESLTKILNRIRTMMQK